MGAKPPSVPPARGSTLREALRAALGEGPASARDLSERVGARERDVVEHLEHLRRSLAARGEELAMDPASCLACGYVFRGRERLTRPSACPRCRGTRIEPPVFRVQRRG